MGGVEVGAGYPVVRAELVGVAFAASLLAGLAIAALGDFGLALVVAMAFVALTAWRPLAGIVCLAIATPLLAGFARGDLVPLLRPHEVVLGAVLLGAGVTAVVRLVRSQSFRLSLQPIDQAFLALAVAGSLVPLLLALGRSTPIDGGGLGQVVILPKYFVLFILTRLVVRTVADARIVMLFTAVVGVFLAVLGIVQSFARDQVADALVGLGYQETDYLLSGRGTATIGNGIIYGTLMALLVPAALSLLLKASGSGDGAGQEQMSWASLGRRRHKLALVGMSALFFLGALSSGQFSPAIAAIVGVVVATIAAGRSRFLLGLPLVVLIAGALLWPRVTDRLDEFRETQGLPVSWQTRLDNLRRFYLPEFADWKDWLFGVRLDVTADYDQVVGEEVFLESGYLWCLWVGGIVLLIAAVAFLLTGIVRTASRARHSDPWIAAAATATLSAFIYIALLLPIDQHLTFRASTDLFVLLLAISMVGQPPPVRLVPVPVDAAT